MTSRSATSTATVVPATVLRDVTPLQGTPVVLETQRARDLVRALAPMVDRQSFQDANASCVELATLLGVQGDPAEKRDNGRITNAVCVHVIRADWRLAQDGVRMLLAEPAQ